jgi:excisionase family DNA binding protein
MTDKDGRELITQSEAAKLRGVTLASINELVRAGRLRFFKAYGKRLVYRDEVLAFEPKTHKAKWSKQAAKARAKSKKSSKAKKK